jgi:hypothetical protein
MSGPVKRARLALLLPDVEKLLGQGTKGKGDGTNVAGQFGVHIDAAPRSGSGSTHTRERGGNSITVSPNKEGKVAGKRSSGF